MNRLQLTFISIGIVLLSCREQDYSHDISLLMKAHEDAREFHFSKNAKGMVDGFADNFISVNRGKVDTILKREEDQARFQVYFDAVTFKKWDDINSPIIRFSDDHSLAYMTIDKIVVLETTDTTGNPIESTTHFAWISIFRKQENGEWKLECVASTNEPEQTRPIPK